MADRQVKLPSLGEGVDGAVVLAVLVEAGDSVKVDQPIVELETDKATTEVPSSEAGIVDEVCVSEGDEISAGTVLLKLRSDEDSEDEASEDESDDDEESGDAKKASDDDEDSDDEDADSDDDDDEESGDDDSDDDDDEESGDDDSDDDAKKASSESDDDEDSDDEDSDDEPKKASAEVDDEDADPDDEDSDDEAKKASSDGDDDEDSDDEAKKASADDDDAESDDDDDAGSDDEAEKASAEGDDDDAKRSSAEGDDAASKTSKSSKEERSSAKSKRSKSSEGKKSSPAKTSKSAKKSSSGDEKSSPSRTSKSAKKSSSSGDEKSSASKKSKSSAAKKSRPSREDESKSSGDDASAGDRSVGLGSSPGAGASPSVRRLARELGIDLDGVAGTGPQGRITEDDVKAFVRQRLQKDAPAEGASRPDFEAFGPVDRAPMSALRRTIARRMAEAHERIPQVTQQDEADVAALRAHLSEERSLTAVLIKAAAQALVRYPALNASLDEQRAELILKRYVHVGVAVDTEDGLIVPVVRDVLDKDVETITAEVRELAEATRDRKISAEQLSGASFTITNLGALGTTFFTPIVPWPQAAILGIGRLRDDRLPLSLSYDHRIADGADAARFLRLVAESLAIPMRSAFRA